MYLEVQLTIALLKCSSHHSMKLDKVRYCTCTYIKSTHSTCNFETIVHVNANRTSCTVYITIQYSNYSVVSLSHYSSSLTVIGVLSIEHHSSKRV